MRDHPVFWQFLSLPLIFLVGIAIMVFQWRHARKLPEYFLLVTTMTLLGLLMGYKLLMEFHPTRFQYSFLPALVLAGLVWMPPYRSAKIWKIITQIMLAVFLITGRKAAIPAIVASPHLQDYGEFLGVRVSPQQAATYEKIKAFRMKNPKESMAFPVKTIYYAYLDMVPEIPFDDLFYGFYSKYQALTRKAIQDGRYK